MENCKKCSFLNLDGTNYCQRCGSYLNETEKGKIKKRNFGLLAGNGLKDVSIAPLAAMGLKKIAENDADLQKVSKKKYVKVLPLEDSSWYCPDCGEHNQPHAFSCKGCGREFGAS